MDATTWAALSRRARRLAVRILPRALVDRVRGQSRPAPLLVTTEEALTRVTQLLSARSYAEARSFADTLSDRPATRPTGALLRGLVAEHRGHHALAVRELDRSPDLAWAHAARPYVNALFRSDPERGLREAEALLRGDRRLAATEWLAVLANVYGPDRTQLVTALLAKADLAADPDDESIHRRLDWVRPWLNTTLNRAAPAAPEGHVSFALIDYRQPGPDGGASSRNIGDWAQTLASSGHLVRHQNVRFHGSPEMVALLETLQDRVRPELRLDTASADVDVSILQRDASRYQEFAPGTWALVFGWFMHPLFDLDTFDFPLHENIRPVFVSFHCAKKAFLSPTAIDYLRRHAPIGCRDWTTVDILLSLGVPAFFSGCLTTTINTAFPDVEQPPAEATLYVDAVRSPVPDGQENVRQSFPGVLSNTFEQNMMSVMQRLDDWRSRFTNVETSRLHVYLPCRSVGMQVRYEPGSFSDPRVNGLLPLSDEGFERIRVGMRDRLAPVMTAILSGADEPTVAQIWRDVNAADVEAAVARHALVHPVASGRPDITAARTQRPTAVSAGPHIVYVPRDGEWAHLPASVRATLTRLSDDATVWVVGDAPDAVAVEDRRVQLVSTARLVDASLSSDDGRTRRLALLPELLPADRAVLLPVASRLTTSPDGLWRADLGARLVAARSSSTSMTSGAQMLFRAARAYDHDVDKANELLRELFRRHPFDPRWIDAEVLVLDLAGMRQAGTAERMLGALDEFGLSWPASLIFELGDDIATLDPAWARVPTRDAETDAKAWVWMDGPKPWAKAYSSSKRLWVNTEHG